MPASSRNTRAAQRAAARRSVTPGSTSSNSSVVSPAARNASSVQVAYARCAAARATAASLADGLRIMTAWRSDVLNCEPVLFMLMLECRCEGRHVDAGGALTILGSPHYREAEAPTPRPSAATGRKAPASQGFVHYRSCRDSQHRRSRSCGIALSGCGLDGARTVAEYPGGLSCRPYGA